MPANTIPLYPLVPNDGTVAITTANTALDGTGTLASAMLAGANGAFIDTLTAVPKAANAATKLTVFLYDGTNTRYLGEAIVPATTASTTAPIGPMIDLLDAIERPGGFALKAGHQLKIGSTITTDMVVFWTGGDY